MPFLLKKIYPSNDALDVSVSLFNEERCEKDPGIKKDGIQPTYLHNNGFGIEEVKGKKKGNHFSLPNMDYLLTEYVGAFGPWQWLIMILCAITTPNSSMLPVYISVDHPHRCQAPAALEHRLMELNMSFSQTARLIGPWFSDFADGQKANDPNGYTYGCNRYHLPANWLANLSKIMDSSCLLKSLQNFVSNASLLQLEDCVDGYVFQATEFQYADSVVADFGLVCSVRWLSATGTAVYMLGMVLGFLFGGWLGDRYGRRRTVLAFSALEMLAGLTVSLAPNFALFALLRCLVGLAMTGKITCLTVLPMELTLADYRSLVSAFRLLVLNSVFPGLLVLSALLLPAHWRWLNAVTMLPAILGLAHLYWLPESPRWLASQGRWPEAMRILISGRRTNMALTPSACCQATRGRILSRDESQLNELAATIMQCPRASHQTTRSHSGRTSTFLMAFFAPLATPHLRRITLLATLLFANHMMAMFGLLLYASRVRQHVNIIVLVNAATYLPGLLVSCLIGRFMRSRRTPLVLLYAICFVSLGTSGLYTFVVAPADDSLLTVGISIGLVCISAALGLLYAYVPELYPSQMRAQGLGTTSGLGRFGAVLCTYVNQLGDSVRHGLPVVVFAGMIGLAFGVLVAMPDTSGENLADNLVMDGEEPEDEVMMMAGTTKNATKLYAEE